MSDSDLAGLKSGEGWLYASSLPLGNGDPGRFPEGSSGKGWRYSHDPEDPYGGGILHPTGRLPAQRLADADTQAVAYAGLHALACFDPGGQWDERATALRARIASAFGPDVMALGKRWDGRRRRSAHAA
jgi:hypothetical protein